MVATTNELVAITKVLVATTKRKEKIKIMELKDTIEMMTSKDYKERFKAEFWQNEIRMRKLAELLDNYEEGKLDFTPNCPIDLLKQQFDAMAKLHNIYLTRANIEGIQLWRGLKL